MNCFTSARSTNAASMASVMFDVVMRRMLLYVLSWSSWVNKAFTARIESLGSEPERAAFLADVKLSTSSVSQSSETLMQIFIKRLIRQTYEYTEERIFIFQLGFELSKQFCDELPTFRKPFTERREKSIFSFIRT